MDTIYLGIDIGDTYSVFYLMDSNGRKIDCDKVMTLCEAEWRTLLAPYKGKDLRTCFEATTHYGWLLDLLSEYSSEVAMINPGDFAVISRSQKKTDRIDAQKLAGGLRRGDLPTVHVPERRVREDRRLVSFVHWHSRRLADIKQRIRALLLPYRLKCPFKNVMGVGGQKGIARILSHIYLKQSLT
jgi:transposase